MYVRTKQACAELGITAETLRRWAKRGYINTIRTDGNQHLYDVDSYKKTKEDERIQGAGPRQLTQTPKAKVVYCRVSSSKQKADLERQVQRLKEKYPDHEIHKEIASGINFKRKALYRLLERALSGELQEIVVAHRDRLCWIAWDHFEWLFTKLGVHLKVDGNDHDDASSSEQLADDLMSIVHVFSSRHYGVRAQRRKNKTPQNEAESEAEDRVPERKEVAAGSDSD